MALTTQQKIYIGVSGLVVCCIAIIIAGVATNWFAPASTSSATNTMCSLRSGAKIITQSDVSPETERKPGMCATTQYSKAGNGWERDDGWVSDPEPGQYNMCTWKNESSYGSCPVGNPYYVDHNSQQEWCGYEYKSDQDKKSCSDLTTESHCKGACQWNPAE